jgi:parallel beta-helix repeat protein
MSFLTSTVDFRAFAQYSQRNPYPRFGEQNATISFSTPHCTKMGRYDWFEMENCSFVTNPGQPMLPVRTVVMKLPERSPILDVSVTVREAPLDGIFSVLPAPSPSIVGSQQPGDSCEDATIYASKSFFPEKWYTFREGHGLDAETNTRVEYVILSIFPLRFLPAEKRVIRAVSVSVKVSYVEALPLTTPSLLKNLIITSPDFETHALQLARWKNQTGVSSRVANTTWIYHNYGGIDGQEQIRTCIKDFVATYGIIYVTIFGDADVVPVRYAYVPDGQDTYTPTDLYYADLDGTWDDNNDQVYADQTYDNVDGIPDVCVGRIPFSLTSYAQVAVDKIIGYQSQFNASQSWARRVVLAAGTGSGDGFSNTLGNASTVLKEYISDIVGDKNIVKLYESAGNLSQGNMLNQINNGALFVNFAGHGDPDTGLFSAGWLFYWVIPGFIWNGFGISEVQLLNNGLKLPVVTTSSCSTARFDDVDCLGEWFVGEPNGGSIAYFGATRIAWSYANDSSPYGLMGEMDRRIYQNYYQGFTRLGQMWGETVSKYVQSYVWNYAYASVYDVKTLMEFELLGDPTIRIYHPDYPETLSVPEDCATIQGAINAAYDGDTILVSSGTYYENVVVHKSVSLIGEDKSSTIIDGNTTASTVQINSNNVKISGFTVQNGTHGILINFASNCTISGNKVTANYEGIYLNESSNNSIIGNSITGNTFDGIYLRSSSNNSIIGNYLKDNYNGIDLRHSSDNNSIYGNNITSNTRDGIELDYIANCNSIFGNSITSNVRNGIELWYSSDNNIYENAIAENKYGVWIGYSSNNSLCHNNFIDNTLQIQVSTMDTIDVWDDGYPSGGNYWSDYNGTDLNTGLDQNVTGSDGIGDTPYTIDENNTDKYPLMRLWTSPDIAVLNVTPSKLNVGQGFLIHINITVMNQGNKIEGFNLKTYANTTSLQTQYFTLVSNNSTTFTYAWNTSGFAEGNYTIWAYAWPVPGETDTADNNFTGGWVLVTIPGDLNGDFKVSLADLVLLANAYGSRPGDLNWNFNADIDGNSVVGLSDLVILANHYGQQFP